ncbi:type II toxin-antitoxin system VapC family toxin [soil metagenome]
MTVVWDTAVLIDILRGHEPAVSYAASLEEIPFCSEVVRVEVIRGLRDRERPMAERLFGEMRWVPVDEAIARGAGEFGKRWGRAHPGLGTPDLIIAATAELLGADLATMNVRHFPMFRPLRTPYRA